MRSTSTSLFLRTWNHLLSRYFPTNSDVYFREEYSSLYADNEDQCLCFTYEQGTNCFLLPVLKRPIPGSTSTYDLESPYGYGGPLSTSDDRDFLAQAYETLISSCKEENVCAVFLRLHPLLANQRFLPSEVIRRERPTVLIPLSGGDREQVLAQMHTTYRNQVRKAERAGVEVDFDHELNELDTFIELYRHTMRRVEASDFYFFSDHYFAKLRQNLSKHAVLALGRHEGQVVSSALLFHWNQFGHYHLGGSLDELWHLHGNKLLFFKSALHLATLGAEQFHLGGGVTAEDDDPLFRFKSRFSDTSQYYFTARIVVDQQSYGRLTTIWEQENPEKIDTYGRYFLRYRY